ncbi:MAG: T9SS type A sorting domain-containing protein [Saprospiraceae bacterium]|nr:T9SS type A sorting domain-containing protein [Saprospiraceae bacterium]
MKKTFLFILSLSTIAPLFAQVCERDSSLLMNDSVFVSPRPYSDSYQVYALAPACIGEPYTQSVTIKVPPIFDFMGVMIPLTNASIATTGAIQGLPSGITYACDPPNCVFNANTLGCIVLYGTPNNPAQAPDTTDLVINASVSAGGLTIPVTFPGPIAPGNYYFVLAEAGACILNTRNYHSQIASVKNVPNPFSDATIISVTSEVTGQFNFEMFDLFGRRVRQQTLALAHGENQFTVEAGDLANGSYFYTISNANGSVTRKMVISR